MCEFCYQSSAAADDSDNGNDDAGVLLTCRGCRNRKVRTFVIARKDGSQRMCRRTDTRTSCLVSRQLALHCDVM